jgi:hypothetical protein
MKTIDVTKRERSPGVYEYTLESAEEYLIAALHIIETIKNGEYFSAPSSSRIDNCNHRFVKVRMSKIAIMACENNCGLARRV